MPQHRKHTRYVPKQRYIYHVVPIPEARVREGRRLVTLHWGVRRQHAESLSGRFATKAEAIVRAKDLAKQYVLGQVIIHKRDGRIETEHTYGADPRRTKN